MNSLQGAAKRCRMPQAASLSPLSSVFLLFAVALLSSVCSASESSSLLPRSSKRLATSEELTDAFNKAHSSFDAEKYSESLQYFDAFLDVRHPHLAALFCLLLTAALRPTPSQSMHTSIAVSSLSDSVAAMTRWIDIRSSVLPYYLSADPLTGPITTGHWHCAR